MVGAEPEIVLAQSEYGAIIHDLASIIAPNGISNAIDSDLANVSGHHAIKVSLGVWPGDSVFVHRRQIEDAGGAANGKVLQFDIKVGVRRGVTHPVAPVIDIAHCLHP